MNFVAVAVMLLVVLVVFAVSKWDARTAYRLLKHSQHLFEPEPALQPATPLIKGTRTLFKCLQTRVMLT